jgi:hypothetical protein
MVAEFSESIVDLVASGNEAPSKGCIVDDVVDNNLGQDASPIIRSMMTDELANELERYWRDAVKAAADVINTPHHFVTKKYYKRKCYPKSKDECRSQVAVFGNGRTGPSEGVRFVPEDSHDDVYLAVALEKRMEGVNGQVKAVNKEIGKAVNSGSLPAADQKNLVERQPASGE